MEHYINSVFYIKKNIIISPYQYNHFFYKYLKRNKIKSYAIITAFNSNSEDLNYNLMLNEKLEKDIQKHKYFSCYGADKISFYSHREDSFFIKNISFKDSLFLCGKYQQDCILYGENEIAKLYDFQGNIIL